MRKTKIVSLILCGALLALVGSFAWAKTTVYDSKTLKWEWKVNGDEDAGGSSTITMKEEAVQKGVTGYSFSGNITDKYEYGFVNVKVIPDEATLDKLKTCTGFSFKIIGDGEALAVKIVTSDVKDFAYYEYRFDTVKGQPITVVVPVGFLMQPSWGKTIGSSVNTQAAQFIEFQTTRNGSPGPFEFKLWDFKLYTGGVPALSSAEKKANDKAVKDAAAAAAKTVKPIGGDLGPMEVKLDDNFEYGDGYQAKITDKRLFNGHKIVPGETYILKITYTASRDLEDVVEVGLVDQSPPSYWTGLTWDDSKDIKMFQLPKSKAGEKVTAEITLTTLKGASGASANANTLTFQTAGEGRKGSKGSGKQKPVTFSFTEFVFTQKK
ncbi:MAG: CIA30 family protein [Treponema sp.]|jgi:hypothetical protein|nr:CIA30 family protein [Treponema sp.]